MTFKTVDEYWAYARDYWAKLGQEPGAITPGPDNEHPQQDVEQLLADLPSDYLKACTLLDFGCGEGRLTPFLAERVCSYHGVDLCAHPHQAPLPANAHFQTLAQLADLDREYHVITSYTVFMHIPYSVLGEILRYLADHVYPGGYLSFQLNGQDLLPEHRYDALPDEDLWMSRWYPDHVFMDLLRPLPMSIIRASFEPKGLILLRYD